MEIEITDVARRVLRWTAVVVASLLLPALTAEAQTCLPGTVDCGGACVDLTTDLLNCGACNAPCSVGQTCDGGSCSLCPGGTVDCGDVCSALVDDTSNCGSCGFVCNMGDVCVAGVCGPSSVQVPLLSTRSVALLMAMLVLAGGAMGLRFASLED